MAESEWCQVNYFSPFKKQWQVYYCLQNKGNTGAAALIACSQKSKMKVEKIEKKWHNR
jgi:hypothetical protein